MMKKNKERTVTYMPPRLTVFHVHVEHGFSLSLGGVGVDSWTNGGTIEGGEAEEVW